MRATIRTITSGLLAAGACLWATSGLALAPGERVEDFRLTDHQGQSHQLSYFGDAPALVIMVQDNACPHVRDAVPSYRALRDAYAPRGVEFFMLNASAGDSREAIARKAAELGIDVPILVDQTQLIGESLGLTHAAEVLVLNPQTWTVAYRGALDAPDSGRRYAADALDRLLDGSAVALAQTDAPGCPVGVAATATDHGAISYADTIAPMLLENCVSCHRPGGIGPWAMTDYNMVRGFAPMIREVVRTQRMPPWHADPAYGHFSNDRSLTAAQTRTLVHWIEAGASRGDGDDPLVAEVEPQPLWGPLGEPDLVIDIPATEVPATGVVDYQYKYVTNPLDHDVWVRASQILPGDRAALHHVITRFGMLETEGPRKGRLSRRGGGGLSGYVPGWVARDLPEGTGTFLPAGATIEFQMHYTTNGKPTVDESRIGIYFHDEPPEHSIQTMILANGRIRIPPHAPAHKESAERAFDTDVLVYSLLPHAHYRGKASEFRAVYPDGSEELLLSVPNYDFNWQTTYELAEPKRLPAGTKIVHTTWWDNSARNPANPDPTREVPWGEQSWDEMLFGAITYRELTAAERESYVAATD